MLARHDRAIDAEDHAAARGVARELALLALLATPVGPTISPRASLYVASDTSWFKWQDAPRVNIRKRRSSRLLLETLVEHRLSIPGKVVPAALLIARGWPGESMRPSSAMSRLYVAVLALRNLGLRDAIVGQDGGYLLDPYVDVLVS